MGLFDRILGRKGQSEEGRDLQHMITKAMNGLELVTATHIATWHLDQAAWSVDQDVGTIVFTRPGGIRAVAPVQIIGTYNTEDGTWLWAWDHPSVLPALAEHARKVLAFAHQHGHERLTLCKLQCAENECWEFTALAFLLCGANGAYRGPAGSARVFMTFGQVQLSKVS